MTLGIYIAAASREIERAERMIAEARDAGLDVVHDWPAVMRAESRADHDIPRAEMRAYLEADLGGVARAHVLWLLVPTPPVTTAMAWGEWVAGYTGRDETGIVLIASGAPVLPPIVRAFADVAFATDAAALEWLRRYDPRAPLDALGDLLVDE